MKSSVYSFPNQLTCNKSNFFFTVKFPNAISRLIIQLQIDMLSILKGKRVLLGQKFSKSQKMHMNTEQQTKLRPLQKTIQEGLRILHLIVYFFCILYIPDAVSSRIRHLRKIEKDQFHWLGKQCIFVVLVWSGLVF